MPPAPAAAAPNGAQQGQQQGGGILPTIFRMFVMWQMMQWFKGGANPASKDPAMMARPVWPRGALVDVELYLSEQPYLQHRADGQLVWAEPGISFAVTPERTKTVVYTPSEAVKNNGSLYLHAYITRVGADGSAAADSGDGSSEEEPAVPKDTVFHRSHPLISYLPRPRNKTGVNLLSGEGAPAVAQPRSSLPEAPREYVPFLKPNATLALLDHWNTYPKNAIPPQVRSMMVFNAEGNYFPLAVFDEFWLLRDKFVAMNDSVVSVDLHLAISPASFWWTQIKQQMEQSFSMQSSMGMTQEGESDEIKRIFLEGNPYLLALTMVVSMLHSVFDFLAFKNDIGFWRSNKSMEGLSARSILINAGCQLVIFLYLLDNETSMVVLLSAGVGTAIEFWKVTKAMHVTLSPAFPFLGFQDRASYKRSDTDKIDAQAMRYLSYALYPLVAGYSGYALLYETHRSWYSWILSSLVGAVYMFGFILMCPQLYLNYRLKSVAHLPWRQMTYKFLNTIIDDLFAFVIKMPTLHRLSVFRDDLIFLIYLYQRWIYRVDPRRVNEFGFAAEQPPEEEEEQPPPLEGQKEGAKGAAEGEGRKKRRDAAAAAVAEADADAGDSGAAAPEPGSKKDK